MSGCTPGAATQIEIGGRQMQFLWLRENSVYQVTDSGWEAINGFFDPLASRVTEGLVVLDFTVMLEPTALDWDTLLPLMWMPESTDTFTLGDTEPSAFGVDINRGPQIHALSGCQINKAVVRHARGDHPQRLELNIFGTSEAISGSIAALTDGVGFPFHQVVCTVQGGAENIDRYAIGIDYRLQREWNNSRTLTGLCSGGREIYLGISTPFTDDEVALYNTPGPSGTLSSNGGSIAYTRGGTSQTWAFEHLQLLASPPGILGKESEVRLDQYYRAYRTVANEALVVTSDPVE